MPLVLTLHRTNDAANRQRDSRTLDTGTLSIGRGPANAWSLDDPAQHLSKTHCVIAAIGPSQDGRTPARYTLTDCSSNGVFLNGARVRMPRDSQVPLQDGDEFALGEYVIQARIVQAQSVQAQSVQALARTAPLPTTPPGEDTLGGDPFGLDDFLAPPPAPAPALRAAPPAPAPRFDPFADPARSERDDPFGTPAFAPSDPFAAQAAHNPFNDPTPRAAPGPRDPFDTPGTPARATPPPPGARRDAFGDDDDLFRGIRPAVEWQGPSQPDNVDAIAHAYVAPKILMPSSDQDWDDLLGDTPPGSPPAMAPPPAARPPAAPVPAAPVPAAPAPPPAAIQAPPPPTPLPPAPPTPAPATADAARLVAAFLEGAGVAGLDVSKQDPETYFREAGALFAAMVESLRDVLMSRAVVKGEFGVEQTMLRPRNNNALKFSVTPQDAVSALLQPGRPGYMPPLQATREAFDDVRIHQLAVMAGVQSALMNLLRTFDPAILESRLAKASVVESLLPATRRAKLWEAFCAAYKDIARDADSDFQAVFGREFARAYTEQAKAK